MPGTDVLNPLPAVPTTPSDDENNPTVSGPASANPKNEHDDLVNQEEHSPSEEYYGLLDLWVDFGVSPDCRLVKEHYRPHEEQKDQEAAQDYEDDHLMLFLEQLRLRFVVQILFNEVFILCIVAQEPFLQGLICHGLVLVQLLIPNLDVFVCDYQSCTGKTS